MDTVNSIIDQGKSLANQYLPSSSDTTTESSASTDTSTGTDTNDLGATNGEAAFSGDIEKSSGPGAAQASGESDYIPYNSLGRDATGSFNGGVNDPPHQGAGIVPK